MTLPDLTFKSSKMTWFHGALSIHFMKLSFFKEANRAAVYSIILFATYIQMKVNVTAVSEVHCERNYTPVELLVFLQGKNFVGKQVVSDVPNTTLVSDLITTLVIQMGLTDLQTCCANVLKKNDVALDSAKTLEQNGVVENDNLKMCVTIELV